MEDLKIKLTIKKINKLILSQILMYIKILGYSNKRNDKNTIVYHIKILKQQNTNLLFISKIFDISCDISLDDYVINILNLIYEYIAYICDEITNFNTNLDMSNKGILFLPNTSSNNISLNYIYSDSIDSMMNELKFKLKEEKQKSKFNKKRD